jgi:hypothetical protein
LVAWRHYPRPLLPAVYAGKCREMELGLGSHMRPENRAVATSCWTSLGLDLGCISLLSVVCIVMHLMPWYTMCSRWLTLIYGSRFIIESLKRFVIQIIHFNVSFVNIRHMLCIQRKFRKHSLMRRCEVGGMTLKQRHVMSRKLHSHVGSQYVREI